MSVILAVDAAWTEREASGVAVLKVSGAHIECLALAPSYDSFLALSRGETIDWELGRFHGSWPGVGALLEQTSRLADAPVDLITVDMPIARSTISGRRFPDTCISKAYGARGCSTHSPNSSRPGVLGEALSSSSAEAGLPIATANTKSGTPGYLIEVYPHPALLSLLRSNYRVPYKVQRSTRYWKSEPHRKRIALLIEQLGRISDALRLELGPLPLSIPEPEKVKHLFYLKRYEDALDALICGWVGIQYLKGAAAAFGDSYSAIWCPLDVEVWTPIDDEGQAIQLNGRQ